MNYGKPNVADIYEIQQFMMMVTGSWPMENSTTWYKIKGAFNYFIVIVFGATMALEAYYDVMTDFSRLSEILYILILVLTYIFKHPSFFIQRKNFIRMMKLLKSPIFLSYPDSLDYLMENTIKNSRLLTNLYRYLIFCCVVLMSLSPFFDNKPLPFPFPYDLGQFKWFMYLFQVIGISSLAWTYPCFDSLLAGLMCVAATHLEILANKLVEIIDDNSGHNKHESEKSSDAANNSVKKKLKECVEHHMAIIEYVEYIEEVFSATVLWQFMGSIIIICNTLFHFVLIPVRSSQFFMLVNYLINILLQIFMYCWFGNEVLLKSQHVRQACYASKWYDYGSEVRKYVFLIMERSKRPLQITAFKFSTLSLTTFTTIIQWSYSYFALLMKLYKEQSFV